MFCTAGLAVQEMLSGKVFCCAAFLKGEGGLEVKIGASGEISRRKKSGIVNVFFILKALFIGSLFKRDSHSGIADKTDGIHSGDFKNDFSQRLEGDRTEKFFQRNFIPAGELA